MNEKTLNDRYHSFFAADFMPIVRYDQNQGAPERSAYASEYAAFHLGQINQKLGRLVALLEQAAQNGSGTDEPKDNETKSSEAKSSVSKSNGASDV